MPAKHLANQNSPRESIAIRLPLTMRSRFLVVVAIRSMWDGGRPREFRPVHVLDINEVNGAGIFAYEEWYENYLDEESDCQSRRPAHHDGQLARQ